MQAEANNILKSLEESVEIPAYEVNHNKSPTIMSPNRTPLVKIRTASYDNQMFRSSENNLGKKPL